MLKITNKSGTDMILSAPSTQPISVKGISTLSGMQPC
jgi:hypothetical protein